MSQSKVALICRMTFGIGMLVATALFIALAVFDIMTVNLNQEMRRVMWTAFVAYSLCRFGFDALKGDAE